MKKNEGFTLIEIILMIGVISLGTIGIYSYYNMTIERQKAKLELEFINDAFYKMETIFNVNQDLTGITSIEDLKKIGVLGEKESSLGINSIENSRNFIKINYIDVSNRVCSNILSSINNKKIKIEINDSAVNVNSISDISNVCNSVQKFSIKYENNSNLANIATVSSARTNISTNNTASINPTIRTPSSAGSVTTVVSGASVEVVQSDTIILGEQEIKACVTNDCGARP